MNKTLEKILILTIDFITINLALVIYYYIRIEIGWLDILKQPDFLQAMLIIFFYWFMIFFFWGMYKSWFAASRFDEILNLLKVTFFGIFILFFFILYDDNVHNNHSDNRFVILIYWAFIFTFVGTGRLLLRSFQRYLLLKGIGRRNALIVGFNPQSNNVHNIITKNRALGIDIKGYIAVKEKNLDKEYLGKKVIGTLKNIKDIIQKQNVSDIIIALEKYESDEMIFVMSSIDSYNLNIKIVPDLYEIISGSVRTSQIYGYPLLEVMPQIIPEWEKKVKRIIDVFVSLLILVVSLPFTIIFTLLIKLDSPGPIFYKQERMGQFGKQFKIYKFRSMVYDAEKDTGPVWSAKNDPRVTKVGKILRSTRIDEIPQLINVLKGQMSLVGPRPERPFFVEKLSQEIPLYKRRLNVRPGITGWAQVKHKYDENLEDVKTKLRYDLFYIENMSLRMDIKILFRTIFVVVFMRGHYN